MTKPGRLPSPTPRLCDLEKRLRRASGELSAAHNALHGILNESVSADIRYAEQSLQEAITALDHLRDDLEHDHASNGVPSHPLLPVLPPDGLDTEFTPNARHSLDMLEQHGAAPRKYYARRLLRADGTLVVLESDHCAEDWIAIANTQGYAERCPHRIHEIELWREGMRIFTSRRTSSPTHLSCLRPLALLARDGFLRLSGLRKAGGQAGDGT